MHALRRCVVVALLFAAAAIPADGQDGTPIAAAARAQVGVTTSYDPSYRRIAFPNGDVPADTGVCADVVVRALRGVGIDLQSEVNADMRAHFSAYPANWGLAKPDRNIDHRRVPNLRRWFQRRGWSLGVKKFVTADGTQYSVAEYVELMRARVAELERINDRMLSQLDDVARAINAR